MHKALLTHPYIGSYSAFLFFGIFGGYLLSRWLAVRALKRLETRSAVPNYRCETV